MLAFCPSFASTVLPPLKMATLFVEFGAEAPPEPPEEHDQFALSCQSFSFPSFAATQYLFCPEHASAVDAKAINITNRAR